MAGAVLSDLPMVLLSPNAGVSCCNGCTLSNHLSWALPLVPHLNFPPGPWTFRSWAFTCYCSSRGCTFTNDLYWLLRVPTQLFSITPSCFQNKYYPWDAYTLLSSAASSRYSLGPQLVCVHPNKTLSRRFYFNEVGLLLITVNHSTPADQYQVF